MLSQLLSVPRGVDGTKDAPKYLQVAASLVWSCLRFEMGPRHIWRAFRSWPSKRDQVIWMVAWMGSEAAATDKTRDTETGQSS